MKIKSFLATILLCCCTLGTLAADKVTISENDSSFTLDNGVISAHISKRSGNITSLTYKNLEMLEAGYGAAGGYWSHDVSRGNRTTRVTIDPNFNAGQRGEVSIKGIFNGRMMGSGAGGSTTADIEIRYALAQGDSGLYAYCIFSHPTNYAATAVGEARFCAKLSDDVFDWMTSSSSPSGTAPSAR